MSEVQERTVLLWVKSHKDSYPELQRNTKKNAIQIEFLDPSICDWMRT